MTYDEKIELGLFSGIVGVCLPLAIVAASIRIES